MAIQLIKLFPIHQNGQILVGWLTRSKIASISQTMKNYLI